MKATLLKEITDDLKESVAFKLMKPDDPVALNRILLTAASQLGIKPEAMRK